MLRFLIPKEGRFFEHFDQSADLIVKAATEFREMLKDLSHIESRARNIKRIEHDADEVTHATIELLHKVFITPIDREDIFALVSKMDDIVDFIEAASERMFLYGITSMTPEAESLADVCVKAAEHVREAVHSLKNLKNPEQIIKSCVEINRLENEGDHILRSGIAKLFREEPDTRNLIKLKEIYELLETVTDRCEDVANIIEGIVLEYA